MKKTKKVSSRSRRKIMVCPPQLSLWKKEVSTTFAHLSQPQCWGLVLLSAGIALSRAAGLAQVSALLSSILGEKEQTVFQRLREWYLDKEQKTGYKRGKKRAELEVTTCFAPLCAWICRLQVWKSSEKPPLALALDATTLRNRWSILVGSVLVAGSAIPVAWKVLAFEEPGSWRPYWEKMLDLLGPSIPADWEVIVLTDRGLYARWLWQAIRREGWHPFLRINIGSKAREVGTESFYWLSHWVSTP